jgi:hypothetical protein
MTDSQPRNPVTGQFISSNEAYQRVLEGIAYGMSAAPAPTSIPRDFETEQRIHNEQLMRASHRRALDRTIEAARERQRTFEANRQKERDDQARINAVERWSAAEAQDKREFLASGGFEEEYHFDREKWIRSEMARGEQIARRMPAANAL